MGYLLAGLVVGPNTPGFVANKHLADQLAEIGVILLMFGVGLHFKFDQLVAVWRVAVPGAIVQSLVATALGCFVGQVFGWGWSAGLVFGLAISVASTVVLLRVLEDNRQLHSPAGHIAVAWLIVEDLFTALVLVVMPAAFAAQPAGLGIGWALAWSLLKVALLIVFVVVGGGRVIPWLLRQIAATHSRELFTLSVLVLALGIAVGAARAFGVSIAFGAFLAGMVVGRSEFSARAAAEALPMRDAFAVLFFVSVGMLLDPAFLLKGSRADCFDLGHHPGGQAADGNGDYRLARSAVARGIGRGRGAWRRLASSRSFWQPLPNSWAFSPKARLTPSSPPP